MESLLELLTHLLLTVGPWVVFFVCMAETAFFVGLLIPAEATVLVAAFLAYSDRFSVVTVLVATFLGALCGDQIGYALGRFAGARVEGRQGRVGRMWRRYEPSAERMFQRHPIFSVSLARFISFVRTLMPWFAGMSRMSYPRYLFFDLLGAFGWAAASVALGYAAGQSWKRVADALGTVSAIVIAAAIAFLVIYVWRKRQRAEVQA